MALYRAVRPFATGVEPSSSRIQKRDREKLDAAWQVQRCQSVRTESAQCAHGVRFLCALPGPARPRQAPPEPGPAVPPADAGDNGAAAYLEALAPDLGLVLGRPLNGSERGLVERWRAAGVRARTVLGAVRDAHEPEPGVRRAPRALQYFDAAVREAHARTAIAVGSAGEDRPPPASSSSAISTWELVKHRLREVVQTQTWEIWFGPTVGHALNGDRLEVLVPVQHVADWIQQNKADVVAQAVSACGLTCRVEYLAERKAAG